MTSAAKMKAQPVPKTVRVRATLAGPLGLPRGGEVETPLTLMVRGALDDGKLTLVEDPEPKTRKRRASGDGQV